MKYMINFQGQISPVFLAMENNFIAPSNNQGGAPMDPRKKDNKPVVHQPEYKHEYEPNQVQNTLYNEDEDDEQEFEGVEISQDEVKILEESLEILKEIEMNATKPGDMKTEVAREILSDMVQVKKRITRLLQTERFTQYQIKELTRLKEKINDYLMSYRNRYNLIKENFRLGIITEPLSKQLKKQESEEENEGQRGSSPLTTEQGSPTSSNGDRHQEEHKKEDPKKKPIKKAEIKGKLIAPPSGWKNPVVQNNPDYINLLDDPVDTNTNNTNNANNTNANPNNNLITKETNLMDDLLSLQFNTTAPTNNTQNVPNQFQGMGANIINPVIMNQQTQGIISPPQNQQTQQTSTTKNVDDDDDFFGSLANRT